MFEGGYVLPKDGGDGFFGEQTLVVAVDQGEVFVTLPLHDLHLGAGLELRSLLNPLQQQLLGPPGSDGRISNILYIEE